MNKTEEKCRDSPATACAMFIYKSKKGVLIHAKSCVYKSYCGTNGTFCKDIALGGSDCRLDCCDGELCNDKEKFKPTTPPGKTQTTKTNIVNTSTMVTTATTMDMPTTPTRGEGVYLTNGFGTVTCAVFLAVAQFLA